MNNLCKKTIPLLGLILLTQWSLCFAQPSQLSFEINPTDESNKPDQHLSYEIKPTKSVEDIMTIKNDSPDTPITIKIYAVDSTQSSDGVVAFKLADAPQENIGTWLKLTQDQITVAPLKSVMVPYTISIPDKVTPGTYEGALVGELISSDNSLENNSIKISSRLTSPLYISIPGRKLIDYTLDEFSYQDGAKPAFNIKFTNRGNVFLKGEVNLHVEGSLLPHGYDVSLNHPTILQGDTYEKSFSFPNPPLLGNYKAKIDFKVSEYNVATGQLKELQTITREIDFNIIPYQCLLILLLIIIIIILAERWRRKHLQEKLDDTFVHTVIKGETITSIADLYQVNWHQIAKLNKLKKPYSLRAGKKLILPLPKPPTNQP